MALTKCRECGHEISTQAASCPSCGRKIPTIAEKAGAIVGILFFVVIAIIWFSSGSNDSGKTATIATTASSPNDAELLNASFKEMNDIENRFNSASDRFVASITQAIINKHPKKAEKERINALSQESLLAMNAALDLSEKIKAPAMANKEASQALTEAIGAHKRWANANRAKLGALSEADLEKVGSFKDLAEQYAVQEASSLLVAYQAVGIAPPDISKTEAK